MHTYVLKNGVRHSTRREKYSKTVMAPKKTVFVAVFVYG